MSDTYERTPMMFSEQQAAFETDFINAHELAKQANEAFDRRHETATKIATLKSPAQVYRAKETFTKAGEDFAFYGEAADTLIPGRAMFEAAEAKQPSEAFASETVWKAMSHEQKAKAIELRGALASGPLKEYGVSEDSLRVVAVEKDGKSSFVLTHTGNGVDIGDSKKDYDKARSHNAVMASKNDQLFQVEINGVTYDSRRGMTSDVYDAKVADARERGRNLAKQ
jgi:hypothetical protein